MSIEANINKLRETVPSNVKIIAVSKFHPSAMVQEAYDAGQREFGESRVQELCEKHEKLPKDIEWHFIGGLQRNKVKYIAPFVSLIHSMDSERLMLEIDKQGAANNRKIACLIQIYIAQEDTKSGFSPDECRQFLSKGLWKTCEHIEWAGVMGMATYTDDEEQVQREFRMLKTLFTEIKSEYFAQDDTFREISMGMSGDYPLAINEGSTIIRVGTKIFGSR